jgi:hypothetical protein
LATVTSPLTTTLPVGGPRQNPTTLSEEYVPGAMEPGAASVPEHVSPEDEAALTVPVPMSTSDSVATSAETRRITFMLHPLR